MRCGVARLPLALLAASSSLLGCDPTSGFADTAGAALPSLKRYFDGPGQKLSDGPWSRVVVDLDSDTLYHLGARRLDDEQPTFHLFDADAREGCAVSPNAGTWLMGKPDTAPFRLLPYLEDIDARGRGRLRFMTLDCEVQEIAVEDAGRPDVRVYDGGYLTPTKRGYTLVNPWSGETQVIAEHLHKVLVWDRTVLLWADGKLKSFGEQFEVGSELGDGVSAVVGLGKSFLMQDETGLSRVDFDRETLELLSTPVLEGACNLQLSSAVPSDGVGAWVSLAMPCDNPKPSLVHLDPSFEVLELVEMPFEADASLARAMTGSGTAGDKGELVAMAYLSEMDEDGFGPLWIYPLASEAPILLGQRADVQSVFLDPSDSEWAGSVQTNYQQLGDYVAYDWLHFGWDGSTELIAERIMRSSSSGQVLVNFDGVAGDVALFGSDGTVVIVAEKVPPNVDQIWSLAGPRRYAHIDQFDGETGRVLLSNEFDWPSLWDPVATGVTPESLRFAWFMPALMFLENWDVEKGTGDLVAYNYELDARATISEGVSSFDLTSYPWDGVVYAVPHGKRQGMWFSKAK